MQLQSNHLNKVRALLYTIWKYFFKEYFEFGSVSPFWIWRGNFLLGSIQFNRESIDSRFLHRTGLSLLLLDPGTPQSLFLPPRIVSNSPPKGSAGQPWWGPSPCCGCGKGCGRGLHTCQSSGWSWGASIGVEGGVLGWRGQAPSS